MPSSVTVEMSLFGAFRKFGDGKAVILTVSQGVSLGDIRRALRELLEKQHPDFSQQSLIEESAIADEHSVLHEDYRVAQNTRLAILPPVCGG